MSDCGFKGGRWKTFNFFNRLTSTIAGGYLMCKAYWTFIFNFYLNCVSKFLVLSKITHLVEKILFCFQEWLKLLEASGSRIEKETENGKWTLIRLIKTTLGGKNNLPRCADKMGKRTNAYCMSRRSRILSAAPSLAEVNDRGISDWQETSG